MDPYDFDGACLWDHLPPGHGSWGMRPPTVPPFCKVTLTNRLDHTIAMARPCPDRRYRYRRTGLLSGARTQGSQIRQEYPRVVRYRPDAHDDSPGGLGGLS